MSASITTSAKTMIPGVARAQQRGGLGLAVKLACSRFSTLPAKNTLSQYTSNESSAQREAKPLVLLTMSPGMASRPYGTSSMEDPVQYHASWANAVRQNAATSVTPRSSRTAAFTPASMETEFDPILSLRSMNPLIFESNYDLEDYGPSFRENIIERQGTLIKEWRIQNERGM
jgi:hypothetical protein